MVRTEEEAISDKIGRTTKDSADTKCLGKLVESANRDPYHEGKGS